MQIGCMRPASPRFSATAITTYSRQTLWSFGRRRPSNRAIRDGNIYARGACDDKGQMYMHIKAVEALRAVSGGKLPVNVKFLIEGEEEVGGESISKYVPEHKDKLKADVALVSDTELFADGVPTLCIGLRGLIYLEIEASGPARDLHSGMYGGAAPNAVYGLIELLAKAKDAQGPYSDSWNLRRCGRSSTGGNRKLAKTSLLRRRISEDRSWIDSAHWRT